MLWNPLPSQRTPHSLVERPREAKDEIDNNDSRIHGKKWEKRLKEKERKRYNLFLFVVWIGFEGPSAAAAVAAAAPLFIIHYFHTVKEQ